MSNLPNDSEPNLDYSGRTVTGALAYGLWIFVCFTLFLGALIQIFAGSIALGIGGLVFAGIVAYLIHVAFNDTNGSGKR